MNLVHRAVTGCILSVIALSACIIPVLSLKENPVPELTPTPTAHVTPMPTPTPTLKATPTPEPTPVMTGSPVPELTAAPQEDLSDYGLSPDALVNPYVTYTYEQLLEDIAQLEVKYPNLITSYSIGKSVEGRELIAFNFGRGKRELLLVSTMHGNEHFCTNFLMYMVDQYCIGYAEDGEFEGVSYRDILDNVKFIVVPMLNPDGVTLAQFGPEAALDPEAVKAIGTGGAAYGYSSWKANINGVDLNGNFKHKWGARDEVHAPAIEGYPGPAPASEPETQAMLELIESTDFYEFVSLHNRGEVIFWLDTDTLDMYNEFYPLAAEYARAFGYELLGPEDVRKRGGYMINSARVQYRKFCITIELCPYSSVDPYPLSVFDQVAADVYPLGLIMGQQALKMDKLSTAVDIILNDKVLAYYKQRPMLDEGAVLAPAFDILNRCGVDWAWYEPKGLLKLSYKGNEVLLKLNSLNMTVNGTKVNLASPMRYEGGTLMIPVLQVLRSLRIDTSWDAENCNVIINTVK